MGQLPHLDETGQARMVDVGDKASTVRIATAEATVGMNPDTADAVFGGSLSKGDAVAVARIAGIQAAKKAADLIPLCHPLAITSVDVTVERVESGAVITSRVGTTSGTVPT